MWTQAQIKDWANFFFLLWFLGVVSIHKLFFAFHQFKTPRLPTRAFSYRIMYNNKFILIFIRILMIDRSESR